MPTLERNAFGELLKILTEEDLIRLRRRAQLAGNDWLAAIFEDELEELYPVLPSSSHGP